MIELQNVQKVFQVGEERVHALRDIDLGIERGQYMSIMGPSGSGKSTLLNVVGLLDRASSGRYLLDGRDISTLDDYERALSRRDKIGFVFQFFHLVPRLTASQNIELPLMLAGVPHGERQQRVQEQLRAFDILDRARHKPDQLSGGQRQRVAIARATVTNPEVVLADEPTGNLDRASGDEVVRVLEELVERNITVLVVTHDPDIGRRASRRIRMDDGYIAADVGSDGGGR
ncbi:MAG: ABC transporter ATP-binding protein [Planctomycetota bacterium]|jgi:putative ABC transport system ATP-binding protein